MIKKLLKPIASHWPFPVLATLKSGRHMYVDLRSGVGRGIYVTGQFDPAVFTAIAAGLRPGGTFIDIGANVGYYSICSLELIGETGQVHAFEIDPRPLKCLLRTVQKFGLDNIQIHQVAASSVKGVGFLTQEPDCGHSHVHSDGSGLAVATTTLDLWHTELPCHSIDVIKIDVEGGEFEVIQGAIETLKKHKPVIVYEANNRLAEIQELLEKTGYQIRELNGCWSPTIVATPLSRP